MMDASQVVVGSGIAIHPENTCPRSLVSNREIIKTGFPYSKKARLWRKSPPLSKPSAFSFTRDYLSA
jgi:hypothetical protein